MIDVDKKTFQIRQSGLIRGIRPVIVKVLKGDYPYKGRYLLTKTDEALYFYQLGLFYNLKKKNAADFKIPYDTLTGYRFAFEKLFYKRCNTYAWRDLSQSGMGIWSPKCVGSV